MSATDRTPLADTAAQVWRDLGRDVTANAASRPLSPAQRVNLAAWHQWLAREKESTK